MTVIESSNAAGCLAPPYIVIKGERSVKSLFDGLASFWELNASSNGWTTDEIRLEWLQDHFIRHIDYTDYGPPDRYRLLVLNGDGSRLTARFDQICSQHKIIPICMPANSSHLLQPLEVACFAALKREYGRLVETQIRDGLDSIYYSVFLFDYPEARFEAYPDTAIQNGFKATGLVPFDPDQVLSRLSTQLKTQTPPRAMGAITQAILSHQRLKTASNYIDRCHR